MSSFSLGIISSWFFPIIMIIAAGAYSIYAYRRTVPTIGTGIKTLLIALRTIALSLLILILFEPVLTRFSSTIEPPRIAAFIDNSISAGEKDAKSNRSKDVKEIINKTKLLKEDSDILKIKLFDESIYEKQNFSNDSLTFSGNTTDISKVIRKLTSSEQNDNLRAGIIITDGAFNAGNNPLYDVNVLDKPLYIIGVGDTSEPKDISIQSIITNEMAYIENPVPVSVNVKLSGYKEGELKVKLMEDGNELSVQSININESQKSYSLNFEYTPKIEGVHKITAQIDALEGEITKKNNSLSEFINVLKNKRKFAIFAGSPSSDVSFISNILKEEKGVEISKYIQKKGSQFYDKEPNALDLKDVEMFFLVGFPIASTSETTMNLIKNELAQGKPLFFLASQNLSWQKLNILDEFLPFRVMSSGQQELQAIADFSAQAVSHPVLRVFGSDKDLELWNSLPPIYRTELYVNEKPESEKIAGFKINNTQMKDPLILSRAFQNKKTLAVLGYGLYRWKLSGFGQEAAKANQEAIDLYSLFIKNSLRWLSVDKDNKNITIKTSKRLYTNGEKVEFIAQVYDAAFSPIDNAKVEVKIIGGNQKRDVILSSLGNGRYHSIVEGLPEGDYYYTGSVVKDNINLGSDKGRFSIGEIALEYQNLSMNAALLREMAERSGGKFYTLSNCSSILDDIKSNSGFKEKTVTTKSEKALWNIFWIMLAVITLLAIEWTIRKRLGLI